MPILKKKNFSMPGTKCWQPSRFWCRIIWTSQPKGPFHATLIVFPVCFVVVRCGLLLESFTHILQGYFTGIARGTIALVSAKQTWIDDSCLPITSSKPKKCFTAMPSLVEELASGHTHRQTRRKRYQVLPLIQINYYVWRWCLRWLQS